MIDVNCYLSVMNCLISESIQKNLNHFLISFTFLILFHFNQKNYQLYLQAHFNTKKSISFWNVQRGLLLDVLYRKEGWIFIYN